MRRVVGVAPWGARSSSLPGYLWLSISICLLFLMFSLVWLGLVPALASPPPSPLPLLRSGRGFGLCRLFPFPGAGLAAPSLCGDCSAALPRAAPSCCGSASSGASLRLFRAVRLFRLFRSSLCEAKGRTSKRGTVQLARTRDTPRAKQSCTENFHRPSHRAHRHFPEVIVADR